jgi:hypothetical protein
MEQNNAPAQAPGGLKALVILSYIGNGFFALIGLLLCVASGWFMSWFSGKVGESHAAMSRMTEGMDSASKAMAEANANTAADAATGFAAMGTTLFIIAGLIIILLNVIPMLGLARMNKMKKSGFILYVIPTGLWTLMAFWGGASSGMIGDFVVGGISLIFIILFGMNMKNMR